MSDREAVAHLLRRATFGPTADEVDAAERVGPAATLDKLLTPPGATGVRWPPRSRRCPPTRTPR
ncbi:DUF1800 domain-containing protein [Micromonospora parastrephiae]|uniref:DUF1800 domain-containing protein n=1 Tax=Micromonospora parastrephiae TaxID=2806101 RepID=UPI001EE40353|nr:DUF1800 domain-containing protein [Micromonospora parastrephiae]